MNDDELKQRHAAARRRAGLNDANAKRSAPGEQPPAGKRPETLNLEDEAKRQAAARARAFKNGKEHVDYFPRLACKVCHLVPWLDDERNVIRSEHDPVLHNTSAGAHVSGGHHVQSAGSTLQNLDVLARAQRARRSAGDDD